MKSPIRLFIGLFFFPIFSPEVERIDRKSEFCCWKMVSPASSMWKISGGYWQFCEFVTFLGWWVHVPLLNGYWFFESPGGYWFCCKIFPSWTQVNSGAGPVFQTARAQGKRLTHQKQHPDDHGQRPLSKLCVFLQDALKIFVLLHRWATWWLMFFIATIVIQVGFPN